MNSIDLQRFQKRLDDIVRDYLKKISSKKRHNHFDRRAVDDYRSKYFHNHGFGILYTENENDYVVKEEDFLEGCTRVYLINPIMKSLLDSHCINNDWKYGDTFADFRISNREYELDSFIEFIAVLDGEKVGVRYTTSKYSSYEMNFLDRDHKFMFDKAAIPGFEKLICNDLCQGAIRQESSQTYSVVTKGIVKEP